jgi:3-hydroxyisobutyrate dehydrogenase
MSRSNVGFIGLGNMGQPMAKNLINDAFDTWMYDVSEKALAELVALGARASTPAEIARNCPLIGICVRDDKDVDSLFYGDEGMLAHAAKDTVIAIHSTITQAALTRWAKDGAARGVHVIDAPVTRGNGGMEPRFVCFLVGGEPDIVERVRPLLDPSAENIIHAGPLGAGMALKLCNNLITNVEYLAVSEAWALAERCGLGIEVFRELGKANNVINDRMYQFLSGRNTLAGLRDETMMRQHFGPFGKLAEKDLDAALESARDHGIELPGTKYARSVIEAVYLNKPY